MNFIEKKHAMTTRSWRCGKWVSGNCGFRPLVLNKQKILFLI